MASPVLGTGDHLRLQQAHIRYSYTSYRYKTSQFTATNNTKSTIKIPKIDKSCGCTEIGMDKETIKPGETTKVAGKITIQPNKGVQVKTLRVHTITEGDPEEKIQALEVVIVAPEGVRIDQNMVEWEQNDNSPKRIIVTVPEKNTSKVGEITSLSEDFSVTSKEGPIGTTTITVTPSGKPVKSALRVVVLNPEPFPLYVKVAKKAAEKAAEKTGQEPTAPQAKTPEAEPPINPTPQVKAPDATGRNSELMLIKTLLRETLRKVEALEQAEK